MTNPTPNDERREPNWPRLYAIVIAELVILTVIFYAFTRMFA